MGAKGRNQRLLAAFAPLGLSLLLPACARSVTDQDCKDLGIHLHELWNAEAKFPDSPTPTTEKAVAVIKSEGQKLEESVITDCKKDLVGKPKATGEFSCLSHAKSLADIRTCAFIPAH